jgi:hypothetical protein
VLVEGRPAEAIVTGNRREHRSGYRVQYEFKDLGGKGWKASVRERRRPVEAGSTMTILYDRDDPATSMMYPFPLVRLGD